MDDSAQESLLPKEHCQKRTLTAGSPITQESTASGKELSRSGPSLITEQHPEEVQPPEQSSKAETPVSADLYRTDSWDPNYRKPEDDQIICKCVVL